MYETIGIETALQRLRADHREVARRLDRLQETLSQVGEAPTHPVVTVLWDFLEFIAHEVWFHFKREEEALFPAISRVFPSENAPIVGGPVFVLTEEHGVLRKLVARFAESVNEWEAQTGGTSDALRLAGAQMLRAFRKHIYKEDNIVFRLTETMLTQEELSAIDVAFAAVPAL